MKASFDIMPSEVEQLSYDMLLLEVGQKTFSYLLYQKQGKNATGLRQFNLEYSHEKKSSQAILEIIESEPALQRAADFTMIVYNFPESTLVPRLIFESSLSSEFVDLNHGATGGVLSKERIRDRELYNVYRIPSDVHRIIQGKFSSGKYCHFYTLLIASIEDEVRQRDQFIKLIFYPDIFVIVVVDKHDLQLVQMYEYHTPEDVAYYLLAICKQLCFNQNKIPLIASGLIDEESSLYLELLKYFQHISWDTMMEASSNGLMKDVPAHYFSTLLKMAQCV